MAVKNDTKLADAENPTAPAKFSGDSDDVDFAGRANWLQVLGANGGGVLVWDHPTRLCR
jgi:hypothetical protein